jgi:aarF domain-containing kinase
MHQAYNYHPGAAILSAIDYKLTMVKNYKSVDEEGEAYSRCHTRSAQRVLKALLANGGLFHSTSGKYIT